MSNGGWGAGLEITIKYLINEKVKKNKIKL